MAEKTAVELVALARQLGGNSSQAPWRDGFSDDPADFIDVPFTWLTALNDAQNDLLETGYLKCFFRFQAEAGRQEYSIDPWLHESTSVTWQDVPLARTTVGYLDEHEPGWRQYAAGTPTRFYFISDQLGVVPAPLVSDDALDTNSFSLVVRADSIASDLVARTDKPVRLNARFHNLLAIGAAIRWCQYDAENSASMRRLNGKMGLIDRWDRLYSELRETVNQRDEDQMDQIRPMEYRDVWRR